MADTPDAIPAFATAARSAILAPMPPLEINATQPGIKARSGNVAEIPRRLAVMNLALRRRAWEANATCAAPSSRPTWWTAWSSPRQNALLKQRFLKYNPLHHDDT